MRSVFLVVAHQIGYDLHLRTQFGTTEEDPNRYILVQRNFVHGKFTTPKSKKSRRVDLSRELRRALLELRDKRMLEAFMAGSFLGGIKWFGASQCGGEKPPFKFDIGTIVRRLRKLPVSAKGVTIKMPFVAKGQF